MSLLLIGLGGAVGTLMRYGLNVAAGSVLGVSWPVGTLAANVLGSLLLGLLSQVLSGAALWGTDLRLILGVGMMGGFTTYSSFNLEILGMLEEGLWLRGAGYAAGTFALCLIAGVAGIALGRAGAGP